MTPDLDQTLSLKASLADDVSPKLEQIDKATKTTQQAVQEMAESAAKAGKDMGSSASGMADSTDDASRRMKGSLGDAGDAFKEFGSAAEEGSKQAGQALEDALYTGKGSSRLNQLEKDLGDLNKTFGGMASTQRVTQGRARNLRAISQDSINKKLIPAFQELHSTLDEYPDTLSQINRLEQDRMDTLSSGGGVLEGVKSRVGHIGEAIEEAKFGFSKAMAAVTATTMGVVGLQVEAQQREMGRIGGAGAFEATPDIIEASIEASRAPIGEFEGAMQALVDAAAVSHQQIPKIIGDIVDLSKATGIADSDLADLRDKIVSLGSVRGEGFIELTSNMAIFAHETRADMTELVALFAEAGDEMIKFSGDARKAYQNAVLAGGAAARQFGIDAGAPKNLLESLQSSNDAYAKGYGLIARVSDTSQAEYQNMVQTGEAGKLYGLIGQGLADQMQGQELTLPWIKEAFQAFTPGMGENEYNRILEVIQSSGGRFDEAYFAEMDKLATKISGGKGVEGLAQTGDAIRGTFTELVERMISTMQQGFVYPGLKSLQTVEYFGEHAFKGMAAAADWITGFDRKHDRRLSSAVGGATGTLAAGKVVSGMAGTAVGALPVPGADKLGGAISSGLGTLLTTAGLGYQMYRSEDSPMQQAFGEQGSGAGFEEDFATWRKGRGYQSPEEKDAEIARAAAAAQRPLSISPQQAMTETRKAYRNKIGLYDKGRMATDLGMGEDANLDELSAGELLGQLAEKRYKKAQLAEYHKQMTTPSSIVEEVNKDAAKEGSVPFTTNEAAIGSTYVFSPKEVLDAQKDSGFVPEQLKGAAGVSIEKQKEGIDKLIATYESQGTAAATQAIESLNTEKALLEEYKKGLLLMEKIATNTKPEQPSTSQAIKPTKPHGVENSEAFLTYDAGRS